MVFILTHLVVPCLHCCHLRRHTWKWHLPCHSYIDLLQHCCLVNYAYLMISHLVHLRYILLFKFSFFFLIFCNTITVLVAVKWWFIVIWFSVRRVFTFGLLHYWYSWDPFKIGCPLVIYVCFYFLERSATLCITCSLIGSFFHLCVWSSFPVGIDMK